MQECALSGLPDVRIDNPGAKAAAVVGEVVVVYQQEQPAVSRHREGLLTADKERLRRLAI